MSSPQDDFEMLVARETAVLTATEAICKLMEEHQVSRAELARRLGVTPQRISNLLNGADRMSVQVLGALAHALGCKVTIKLEPNVEDGGS